RSVVDSLAVAHRACHPLGLRLFKLKEDLLPPPGEELEEMLDLWRRECLLDPIALFVDGHSSGSDMLFGPSLERFVDCFPQPLFLAVPSRRSATARRTVVLPVEAATATEQRDMWAAQLNSWPSELQPAEPEWIDDASELLMANFALDTTALQGAALQAIGEVTTKLRADPDCDLSTLARRALWNACKSQLSPRIGHLAQLLPGGVELDDVVTNDSVREVFRQIEIHIRHRDRVHRCWGFTDAGGRGKGTTVLLAGPPGTGKTMAAEALASSLDLDLYRVDLSNVISKYIGETEKNLAKIFDAAEAGGVVLLFDEADALFGKRSEVKDSRDRHANIEVSYLLQRMEAFNGLSILTTNLKEGLDHAFLRRIRFVLDFAFPNASQRELIWQKSIPPRAPIRDLDMAKLARLNVAGGEIRNIVVNAAFRAAADGDDASIDMGHMRESARLEYQKAQHTLSDREVGDWE
ncbi:MAG: ATP-binding protein, partial [Proteobacteria bacterium]|nr:ATP-binding protein [Pseudomonadota bacterium]